MYLIFRIRTDTTKEGSGAFVAIFDTWEAAQAEVKRLNTPGVREESLMYVVEECKVNDINEARVGW